MLVGQAHVTLQDGFLGTWRDALLMHGIEHQWNWCESTGRLENFRRVAAGSTEYASAALYDDSDVHKIAEATAYALALKPTDRLRERWDAWLTLLEGAIQPDGYLHTWTTILHPEKRYLSLSRCHEIYCMGHALEALSAGIEVLADARAEALATRIADHLNHTFGPDRRPGSCGHPEVELALIRLGKLLGRPEYIELGKWMTDSRGTRPSPFEAEMRDPIAREHSTGYPALVMKGDVYDGSYFQDDLPLRQQTEAKGHSVRLMYLLCGALDGFASDPEMVGQVQKIWSNMVDRRTYITGGIGSSGKNEGFTTDYDLPNADAYAETCAAIGLCMVASRLARIENSARRFDQFETALMNNVLAGMNVFGTGYHYANPLASPTGVLRNSWFFCSCCPPNVARFLLSLERAFVQTDESEITIWQPVSMEVRLPEGLLTIKSDLPFDGGFQVLWTPSEGSTAPRLRIRLPIAHEAATVHGPGEIINGFLTASLPSDHDWQTTVTAAFAPEVIHAHPRIEANLGRVAVRRGSLVFCLEADRAEAHSFTPATKLTFDRRSVQARSVEQTDHKGGIVPATGDTLTAELPVITATNLAVVKDDPEAQNLYQKDAFATYEKSQELMPYAYWNNRGKTPMAVWIRSTN